LLQNNITGAIYLFQNNIAAAINGQDNLGNTPLHLAAQVIRLKIKYHPPTPEKKYK